MITQDDIIEIKTYFEKYKHRLEEKCFEARLAGKIISTAEIDAVNKAFEVAIELIEKIAESHEPRA